MPSFLYCWPPSSLPKSRGSCLRETQIVESSSTSAAAATTGASASSVNVFFYCSTNATNETTPYFSFIHVGPSSTETDINETTPLIDVSRARGGAWNLLEKAACFVSSAEKDGAAAAVRVEHGETDALNQGLEDVEDGSSSYRSGS